MPDKHEIVKRVRRALEFEARVNLRKHPVTIGFADGAVILEGETADVAAKKITLELAGAAEGVRGVIDRLRVTPAARRGDGAIRDILSAFLLNETELRTCSIRLRGNGVKVLREVSADGAGEIEISVGDGVVTLEGRVISLSHKRVAGVLAWWTPGCCDVVNSLDVQPPEDDNDAEVVDALRLVFEIDPRVDAGQIRARCDDYVVTLEGCVRNAHERRQAEHDAWCLFAVDKVVNRIEIRG